MAQDARREARRVIVYPPGMGRAPKPGGHAGPKRQARSSPAPGKGMAPWLPAHARTPAKQSPAAPDRCTARKTSARKGGKNGFT